MSDNLCTRRQELHPQSFSNRGYLLVGSVLDDSRRHTIQVICPRAPTPTRPTKENSLRASQQSDKLETQVCYSEDSPVHTIDSTSPRRRTGTQNPRFSCRRWRNLRGDMVVKLTESRNPSEAKTTANPPRHWTPNQTATGFVSVFPSSPDSTSYRSKRGSPPGRTGSRWQTIDKFDSGVMKKLVDKAYGITERHRIAQEFPLQHGNRAAQRKFIHGQVYLPSVHRTVDYLQRARESSVAADLPGSVSSSQSPTRASKLKPGPLGSNLLSSQLQTLQQELLAHYEAERRQSGSVLETQVWSPRPPQPRASCQSSPSSCSPPEHQSGIHSSSFRSYRHTRRMSRRGSERDSTVVTLQSDDDEEGILYTDSDTYSLSSGVEGGSETEERILPSVDVNSTLSSGTESWPSLESHVLVALEGSDAAMIGSVQDPLSLVDDSEDLVHFSETSNSSNSSIQEVLLSEDDTPGINPSTGDHTREHVIYLDNGIRVDSMGRAIAQVSDLADDFAAIERGDCEATTLQMFEDRFESQGEHETRQPGEREVSEASNQGTSSAEQPEADPEAWILPCLTSPVSDRGRENEPAEHFTLKSGTSCTASEVIHVDSSDQIESLDPLKFARQLPIADVVVIVPILPRMDDVEVQGAVAREFEPQQEPQHRYSISSTAAYDETDFEDIDADDETQGYESFEE